MTDNHEPDERRLRSAFEALRADDARRAPDFATMARRPAPPPRVRALPALAASLALAAGVSAFWLHDGEVATEPAASAVAAAPATAPAGEGATEALAPRPVAAGAPPAQIAQVARDDVAPLDFLLAAPPGALRAEASSSLDFLLPR